MGSSTKDIDKKVSKKSNSVKTKNIEKKISKKSSNKVKKKEVSIKDNFINIIKDKKFIISFILVILDLGLIIYTARGNIANYVNISGKDIFVGKTKNLFFGRNYVTLVITLFMYIYWLVVDKFLLKNKINIKRWLIVLVLLLLFNMMMFCLFTNRVY